MSDAPTPTLHKRHRLARWYANEANHQGLRTVVSNPFFHEAMDLARNYAAPTSSGWVQDGQSTLTALALAQAEQTGWNNALEFLVSLTEQPAPPKAPTPAAYTHLQEQFRKTLSPEDRKALEEQLNQ